MGCSTLSGVMRRLFAAKLLIVLLTPWFLTQGAGLRAVVPCPMHSGHTLATHTPSGTPSESHDGMSRHSDGGGDHGTTAKGCNCVGDCGRTVTHIAFPAPKDTQVRIADAPRIDILRDQISVSATAFDVPFATGPPERLLFSA
jgi:hypothetical protein